MTKLKLSKINQLSKYKNYKKVDYRDTIFKNNFHRLDKQVVGAGNHDYIISNKKDRTYMTFCSESPFGKKLKKLLIEICRTEQSEDYLKAENIQKDK